MLSLSLSFGCFFICLTHFLKSQLPPLFKERLPSLASVAYPRPNNLVLSHGRTVIAPVVLSADGDACDGSADSIQVAQL